MWKWFQYHRTGPAGNRDVFAGVHWAVHILMRVVEGLGFHQQDFGAQYLCLINFGKSHPPYS